MVIKRKYATYGQLLKDELSRKAIVSALEKEGWSEEKSINHITTYLTNCFVFHTDLGSGLPGLAFKDIKDRFEVLDKEHPFENGLNYIDVTKTYSLPSRKGNAITQVLVCQHWDNPPLIVQVVAFEKEGNGIKVIKPWDVSELMI